MAVRTTTATDLDAKINALFVSYDAYVGAGQRGQPGEPKSAAEKYFWEVFMHKARQRVTLKRLIDTGFQPRPIPKLETATVVSQDPFA